MTSLKAIALRSAFIALPVALLQVGIHGGDAGASAVAEVGRAALSIIPAVAVVMVVLSLIWPGVRRRLGLQGASDTVGSVVALAFGVSVAMMVMSALHGLLESTSTAGHSGMVSAGHHQMSAFEHAVRDGGAVGPLVLVVASVLMGGQALLARLRRRSATANVAGVARWSVLAGLTAGFVAIAPINVSVVSAVPAAPACDGTTAVRSYDVAAAHAFIPYSRWINDALAPVNGPDGFPHLTDGDPNGMVFVLQQDKLATQNWYVPVTGNPTDGYADDVANGRRLRPRPLVLRANAGECIQVTLTNELTPAAMAPFLPQVDPRVSIHAFGVPFTPNTGDGSMVGFNADTTVGVGESITYFWRAPSSEGLYLFRDMGMPAGANVDGGGAEHGLYGALAVQPTGARWFDPVSGQELSNGPNTPGAATPQYTNVANQSGELYIDAVIALPANPASPGVPANPAGRRYRESIQLSQDVLPLVGAALGVEPPERFGFNYGSEAEYKRVDFKPDWCADCVGEETGLSSWTFGDPATVKLASGSGPWEPVQPQYAEGEDPLAVPAGIPATINVENCNLFLTNAIGEDRPVSCYTANVTRAYQGDPIKIRFGQAGVFETHVFHLHAHTWAAEPDDNGPAGSVPPKPAAPNNLPRATTVDSQTYGPWTGFTADLNYGAGARIGTVGDSIYHCHLYPHFAAGFWALLRVHDAYENGQGATPDGHRVNQWLALREIGVGAVPIAASVPPIKNLPSIDLPGFPRFIPGTYGWRAPQPVNSIFQREFDAVTGEVVLNGAGNPVEAPATRIVAGRGLDPALLDNNQTIATDATDGTFTLTFGGETTAPLAPNATAAQVRDALQALPNIDAVLVDGIGTVADPWDVQLVLWRHEADLTITATYTPAVAPPAVTVAPTVPPQQSIVVGAGVTEFTLTVGAETTAPIAATAEAAAVQAALEALTGVLTAAVTGAGTEADPFLVDLTTDVGIDPAITAAVTAPVAATVVVTPAAAFDLADPALARLSFQLAQEQHTTRKFHDPAYVAGGPVNPLRQPIPGAPVVNPCPANSRVVTYRASVIQLPLVYNEAEWVDFQGRVLVADENVIPILSGEMEPEPFFFRVNAGDCIDFELTNRTPNHIGNDVYQQLVETNMVGGHIHLVNFDVLASDGSSNGWNYQQAAFTEAQATFNQNVLDGVQPCVLGNCTVGVPAVYDPAADGQAILAGQAAGIPDQRWLAEGQTLKERWFADYEVRTVFMHDHHFAAVMQNRGMFNALIVEPAGFDSRDPVTGQWLQPINNPARGPICGTACLGTAHGSIMDMVGPGVGDDFREFGVAVHDFIPLFIPPNGGGVGDLNFANINIPDNAIAPPAAPLAAPDGDQGGMGVNYKNAPMKIRQFPAGAPNELGQQVDPAYTFSSRVWGDPATPILKAYRGDNVRIRLIQGSHEEQHNFTMNGVRWRKDAQDPASPYINSRAIGVSEAFNIDDLGVGCGLGVTGQCFDFQPGQPRVADFWYGGLGVEDMWNGAWGMMRVMDQTLDSGARRGPGALLPLPDNPVTPPAGVPLPAAGIQNLVGAPGAATPQLELPRAQLNISCPTGSVFKGFNVSVIDVPITYNRFGDNDPFGLAYVLTADVAAIRAGTKALEPLVLRANENDCIVVNLRNEVNWAAWQAHGVLGTLDGDAPMPLEPVPPAPLDPGEVPPPDFVPWFAGQRVSMHPSLLRYDVRTSDGATVGYSFDQTAGPGQTVSYLWYADEIQYTDPLNPSGLTDGELGVTPLLDFGDARGHRHHGLLAALVVGPKNATFHDQFTGAQVHTGVNVDVRIAGSDDYRDTVLFQHNGLNIRNAAGVVQDDPIPGDWPDLGERAISYRNAPLHHRLGEALPLVNPLRDGLLAPFNQPGFGEDLAKVFSSTHVNRLGQQAGDPDTPIIRAYQGDPLRVHVVQSSDRARMLETEISGHNWLEHAFDAGSVRAGVQGSMATGSAFTFHLAAAGGDMQRIGDYRYGSIHGVSALSSGSWGIVRVYPTPPAGLEGLLSPLATSQNPYEGGNPIRVLNLDDDPVAPAPAVAISVAAPLGFGLLAQVPADTIEVNATVTAADGALVGQPLANQSVVFTYPGGNSGPVSTNALGVATFQVPVTGTTPGNITVTATVTPTTGNPASANIQVTFVNPNDAVAPTVASVVPADLATGVAAGATVQVTFSEQVNPATVTTDSVQLLDGASNPVPATVTLSADRMVATLTPTAPLALGAGYTVNVATTITDLVGNALGAPFTSTFTTLTTAPSAPLNVTATVQNVQTAGSLNGEVLVEWTAPASDGGTPITGYTVTPSSAIPGITVSCESTTATSCLVTGLVNGLANTFSVVAENANGPGAPGVAGPVTPRSVPGAPSNVAANLGGGSATVTWTNGPINGAALTGYEIEVTADGDLERTVACGLETHPGGCVVTGLQMGADYSFRVRASNAAGWSAWSAPTDPAEASQAPGSPTALTATPAGPGSMTIGWTAPADDGGSPITGYTVSAAPGGAGCTTGGAGTSCTVVGLTAGVAYTFSVVATNSAGTSQPATVDATVATIPGAPTGVVATPGDASVTVSWTPPASDGGAPITGYIVSSTSASGTATCTAAAPATSCTVTGLENNEFQLIWVQAQNLAGVGAFSFPFASATPVSSDPGDSLELAPVTATQTGNGQVAVSWTAATAPVVNYRLQMSVDGGPWLFAASSVSPSATVNGLASGPEYQFRVRAWTGTAFGPYATGDPIVLEDIGTDPLSVEPVSAVQTGAGQVTVSWSTAASAVVNYRVQMSVDGGPWLFAASSVSPSATINGLATGPEYRFRVRVFTGSVFGPNATSDPIVLTEVVEDPLSVAPASVVQTGPGQVTVSWSTPTASVVNYRVQMSVDGGPWLFAASSTSPSATINGLATGPEHRFRVRVFTGSEFGPNTTVGPIVVA